MANLAAVGHLFGDGVWVDGDVLVDPTNDTVLVDTGPLAGSRYLFAVSATASVAVVYDIQLRNASNSASLHVQRRRCAANSNDDYYFANKFWLTANERCRVVLVGSITGNIQVGCFYVEAG